MSAADSSQLPLWVQDRDAVIQQTADSQWRYKLPPEYHRTNAFL